MGALNREYIYRMLNEENEDDIERDTLASKNSFFNKHVTQRLARSGVKFGSKFGATGAKIGGFGGAIGGALSPALSKIFISGNQGNAKNIADYASLHTNGFLSDPTLIQALGVTPYVMQQMGNVGKNLNHIRNMDAKFTSNEDFARYGSMASAGHMLKNVSSFVPAFAGAGAAAAGLTGHGALAAGLAHLNPMILGSKVGMGLGGWLAGLGSLTGGASLIPSALLTLGLMGGSMKLMNGMNTLGVKTQSKKRIALPMTVSGAQTIYTQSTYKQHLNQIGIYQNNGLLGPKDALMLAILNDINLNTAPLRIDYTKREGSKEKEFHNVNARNRLLDLYDPDEDKFKDNKLILNDEDLAASNLSPQEIQKRKASYHLNTTVSLLGNLGLSSLAGPLASVFTGKSYGETRKDIFDILFGNNKLRAQAHEEAHDHLNLPTSLMAAIYTPVTKWLNFETPETQQLAILANMHELNRSAALSLVGINKALGGDKIKGNNVYSLIDDLEEKHLQRGVDTDELKADGFTNTLGGPLGLLAKTAWGGIKHVGSGIGLLARTIPYFATRGINGYIDEKFGTNQQAVAREGILSHRSKFFDPYKKLAAGYNYLNTTDVTDVLKDFRGKLQNGIFSQGLKKRLGFVNEDEINDVFNNSLEEASEYSKSDAAYTFLGDHFPDLTMEMLHELKQQTAYLNDLLTCQDCKKTTIKKSDAKWRGSEGDFLNDNDFTNSLFAKALNKTRETLKYDDLKNTKFGKVSGFLYKNLFGIKEKDFTDIADYIDNGIVNPYMNEVDFSEGFNEANNEGGNSTSSTGYTGTAQNRNNESGSNRNIFGTQGNLYRGSATSLHGYWSNIPDSGTQGNPYRRPIKGISGTQGNLYRGRTLNDEEIQNELKKKEREDLIFNNSKKDTKNLDIIRRNTAFNVKIFKLLKKEAKEIQVARANNTSSDSSSNLLLELGAGAVGIGAWAWKKYKDHKINRANRAASETHNETHGKTEESKPKTKTWEKIKQGGKKVGKTIAQLAGKAKLLAKLFLDYLGRGFAKIGLKKLFDKVIFRMAATAVAGMAVAGLTFGFSGFISGLIDSATAAYYVVKYYPVFKEAWSKTWEAFEIKRQAEEDERTMKSINLHARSFTTNYVAGTLSKKEFDKAINDVGLTKKLFRNGGSNYAHFKSNDLKDYNKIPVQNLEKLYYYFNKHKEFKSEKERKQFADYIKFRKSHNAKLKNLSEKELEEKFSAYEKQETYEANKTKKIQEIQKEHKKVSEASVGMLGEIHNLMASSNNILLQMAHSINDLVTVLSAKQVKNLTSVS